MPDQLVGERAGDAGEVERHRAVLEHRQVADLEDVPQVARVGRRGRVRLVPRLVAGPAGELGERLAAVGIGAPTARRPGAEVRPGDSGGYSNLWGSFGGSADVRAFTTDGYFITPVTVRGSVDGSGERSVHNGHATPRLSWKRRPARGAARYSR